MIILLYIVFSNYIIIDMEKFIFYKANFCCYVATYAGIVQVNKSSSYNTG